MADKRKRTAPTIDLKATEVEPEASESAAAPEAQSPPQDSAAPSPPALDEGAQAAPGQGGEEAPAAAERSPKESAPPRKSYAGIYAAALTSGIVGAGVVVAAIAGLWYVGLLPLSAPPPKENGQSAQIAALQKQIEELRNRPVPKPAAPDTQAVDALRQRVAKLERDIANLPPGDKTVAARLAKADDALKSLETAVTALNKRSDDIAGKAAQAEQQAAAAAKAVSDLRDSVQRASSEAPSAVDTGALDALRQQVAALEPLQKRVAAVEQSVKAVRSEIAQASATDEAARLALSAAALRAAVMSGAPYQAELAQAKALGGEEKALAPLAHFAASGVPGKADLAKQLRALVPAMMKASGAQKPPSGFFERLQANAGSLVRVTPVNAPQGDKPADVLARIEVDAARDDIAAALADLAKLPAAARAPAQDWIAKAKARQAARAAARRFSADAAQALGKS
jgi:hypothetical protein